MDMKCYWVKKYQTRERMIEIRTTIVKLKLRGKVSVEKDE